MVPNTADDPANTMQRLMPNFCGCPELYGKAFVVELDQQGKPASVIAHQAAKTLQSASTHS